MPDQTIDYPLLADRLCRTALDAGQEIMRIYAQDFDVAIKADSSPVTAADAAAEKIILRDLHELTPHIPIVAEEQASAGHIPEVNDCFWLVDPLDGTKEFIRKGVDFTVNIALIVQDQPTFGLVYAPATGQFFMTRTPENAIQMIIRDGDAITAEQPLMVRDVPAPGHLAAVASRSHRDAQTNAFLKTHDIHDVVSTGSSLKFCLVAGGEADIYPRFGPTMEWDTGAGHAVLKAAGGAVVHPDGTVFGYRKKSFRNGAFIAGSRAALNHIYKVTS